MSVRPRMNPIGRRSGDPRTRRAPTDADRAEAAAIVAEIDPTPVANKQASVEDGGCKHKAPYIYAVRVKDGEVTFRKLGTSKNRNVVATWCERCGMIAIFGPGTYHLPRARVIEGAL